MKKNLLFALTVFALTISGLLVFCQTPDTAKNDSIENHQTLEDDEDKAVAHLGK